MKKSTKYIILGLVVCILLAGIGFFLYIPVIPIQDIELLTEAELLAYHKEAALNYSLGKVMLYGGMLGGGGCIAALVLRKIFSGEK